MNPYAPYYVNQAGSGLSGFSGVRYQRGHGFFGRLFSGIGSFAKEVLPSIGKRLLPSGIGLAQDILSGENVLKSAKSRLIEAGKNVADETLEKIKSRVQTGSGILKRRKRRRTMFIKPLVMVNKKHKVMKRKVTKKRKRVNKKGKKNHRFNFLQ